MLRHAERRSRIDYMYKLLGLHGSTARVIRAGKSADSFGSAGPLHFYLKEIARICQHAILFGKSARANDTGKRFAQAP